MASAFVPPAGTPDLSQMVLRPSDLATAGKIVSQGYIPASGFLAAYDRQFGMSLASGGEPLLFVDARVLLATDANTATLEYASSQGLFRFPRFVRAWAAALMTGHAKRRGHGVAITVGHARPLGVGADSLLVPLRIEMHGAWIPIDVGLVRVDRVDSILVLVGIPGGTISPGTAAGLAGSMVAHIHAGLLPQSTAAPTVTGTPAHGQTLTATTGTWTNSPTGFSYEWQRCSAAGSSCTPIAGATGSSYTPTAADVGDTLEVTVTATNTDGSSATATSSTTAVVS
jgi:hypothetical protein